MTNPLLSPDERRAIEAFLSEDKPPVLQRRARLLLAYDDGLPTRQAAALSGLSRSRARHWHHQFIEERMGIFQELHPKQAHTPRIRVARKATEIARIDEPSPAPIEITGEEIQPAEKTPDNVILLAGSLFDRTLLIHRLEPHRRRLMQLALELPRLPANQSLKKNRRFVHEHLKMMVSEMPQPGLEAGDPGYAIAPLTQEDENLLTALMLYNQGQVSKKELGKMGLPEQAVREVQLFAALLHVANGLDAAQVELKLPLVPIKLAAPGVLPDDPLSEAGRKVLRYHFNEMLRHEDGTRAGVDIEALHDMRVATRRMRAGFEVFAGAFEQSALAIHLKGLRLTGRMLGHVRDLDVFMEKAQHYLETLPEEARSGLDPLLHAWEEERNLARQQMLLHLESMEYELFKQEFNLFLNTPGAGQRRTEAGQPRLVKELAPVLVYERLASVRAFDAIINHATIEQLHALRIEFKKLRYTVEFFREVMGDEAKEVINEFKKMQDHLGDLNDAQVATVFLSQFLHDDEERQVSLPLNERHNLEPVVAYQAYRYAERHRLLTTFQPAWENFNRPEMRQKIALAVSVL